MPRLRRSDCSGPGIRRRGRGRGFEYLDTDGERIGDPETRARIDELAIPPAWTDVWICSDPLGHLQATGIDAAGRKQYLYHPGWRRRRDAEKFERMVELARALPRLRRRVAADLGREEIDRERVLAAAVRLLDRGAFRIGGEDYAEQNDTYGLATLRREHVRIVDGEIVFDYEGKGGQRQIATVGDAELIPVIERLRRRRGGEGELLAYRNGRGWRDVRSDDINEYLKEIAGADFSAKDFRPWHATVLAAWALAAAGPPPPTKAGRRRIESAAVEQVAELLGNTPAVARSSYVDPRVFDRYRAGVTVAAGVGRAHSPAGIEDRSARRRLERAVIGLLEE